MNNHNREESNLMNWEIDAVHSQATFAVKHLMISTVKGRFNVLRGKLNIDQGRPENSWVEAEVDVASIDTGESNRDTHLRSADFFNVEQYPRITLKSTKVEPGESNEYTVVGDLTMHRITKEVVFTVAYSG
jgi:polyisoprenoid-binding protein YceI